jgi:hypothetical protein
MIHGGLHLLHGSLARGPWGLDSVNCWAVDSDRKELAHAHKQARKLK